MQLPVEEGAGGSAPRGMAQTRPSMPGTLPLLLPLPPVCSPCSDPKVPEAQRGGCALSLCREHPDSALFCLLSHPLFLTPQA